MSINKNNIDEWHERFVLGLLDEEELRHYEAYLKATPGAREEQREWADIIGGVEQAAHADLKREIRRQVEQVKYHDSPYILWYRVAAILFFIVLLPAVIYFNYPGAMPPLARQESVTTKKSVEKELIAGEETADNTTAVAGQAPPEQSAPVLSPPPARTDNAGYGSGGATPPQKAADKTPLPDKRVESRKSTQGALLQKSKPARRETGITDIQGRKQPPPPKRSFSPLRALSASAPESRSDMQDIHPPALPVEKSSTPILIRGKSGRTYRVSTLSVQATDSVADSIGFMINEDSADTRLILVNLPGKLTRLLKQMTIDDRGGKELILSFPGNIRYRMPRGSQTGQARKIP